MSEELRESESNVPWRGLRYALVAVWAILIVHLMVADLWDETNGMVAFSDPAHSLWWNLHFVFTRSLGFYRPLPSAFAAALLHLIPGFSISWKLLRASNALILIAAAALFCDALGRWNGPSARRDLLLTAVLLFSGSGIITAGWYANLFDAWSLLLVAAGISLLSRDRDVAAGITFGVGFFCKETTVLALPFLVILLAARRLTFRAALRAGIPAAILGGIYFAIRSRIVPFGTAADIHGFQRELFLPTVRNLLESFWRQTLKGNGWGVAGFAFTAVSLIALRRARLIGAVLLLLLATAIIYWQMILPYQDGLLVSHFNFVGRLYLVPVALFLFVLFLEKREMVVYLLLIPIVAGAASTYRDHLRVQRTYRRLYRAVATSAVKPVMVDYAEKPLHDPVRGIEIGAYPCAHVAIDPHSGVVLYR